MEVTIVCKCQSRMEVANGIAVCRNSACKKFGKEFHAPDLDLQEVVPVSEGVSEAVSTLETNIPVAAVAEPQSDQG